MRCLLLLSCGVMFGSTPTQAQAPAPLLGLRGVQVRVDIHWRDMPPGVVSQASLQSEIELELRRVGITVLSQEEWRLTPGRPLLVVQLSCLTLPQGSSCALMVNLLQRVTLERDPTIAGQQAVTWTSGVGIVTIGRDGGGDYLSENVRDNVRQFANDFLAANPRH